MKKKILYILILWSIGVFCSPSFASDQSDVDLPVVIQKDIFSYIKHLTDANYRGMLADLNSLEKHLVPTYEMIDQDLNAYMKFADSNELEELRTVCQLVKAGVYFVLEDTVSGMKCLPTTYTYYCRGYLREESHTPLCDFMEAYANFFYQMRDFSSKAYISREGYDARVNRVTDILGCYATMKRCVGERPYYTSETMEYVVAPSKNKYINMLLINALYFIMPYGFTKDNIDFLTDIKYTKETLTIVSKGVCDMIENLMPEALGLRGKNELNFLAQYAFDFAINNYTHITDIQQKYLFSYDVLNVLSDFGYSDATFMLGIYSETDKYRNIHLPKMSETERYNRAYTLYQKALRQGSNVAKIRIAHCMAFGYGCKENKQEAFKMLQSLRYDHGFSEYGAYAYAVMLDKGMGGNNVSTQDIMEALAEAGYNAVKYSEQKAAQSLNDMYYEKYYK